VNLYKFLCSLCLLLVSYTINAQSVSEADTHKVQHVVIVWLKQHGDAAAQQQYIAASKPFAALPGVLSYAVGTPAVSKRERPNPALDESYDIAISSSFENQQAYEEFLKNPDYVKAAMEVLRPLVDKYRVYDFVE
jgi:Stress responsive A/B Barrel Domain